MYLVTHEVWKEREREMRQVAKQGRIRLERAFTEVSFASE